MIAINFEVPAGVTKPKASVSGFTDPDLARTRSSDFDILESAFERIARQAFTADASLAITAILSTTAVMILRSLSLAIHSVQVAPSLT